MGIATRVMTKTAALGYGVLLAWVAAPASAAVSLSNTPLFLTVTMPPNITVTLDDSGSMSRAWVPENCPGTGHIVDCAALDNRYEKAANRNLIYYNPNVKYSPAKQIDADGKAADRLTSFTAALRNGFYSTYGTVDLSKDYKPTAALYLDPNEKIDLASRSSETWMGHSEDDVQCGEKTAQRCAIKVSGTWQNVSSTAKCDKDSQCSGKQGSNTTPIGTPAYYYVYTEGNAGCDKKATTNACYTLKLVTSTSGPGMLDLNDDGKIDANDKDERQNFANWYSFARTRNLATATAASLAFADLDTNARVAWQALNTCKLTDKDCDGWRGLTDIPNAINTFTGQHKRNFYSWLAQLPTDDGTPLPAATKRVGEYYKTTGENSPYDNDFTDNNSKKQYACRRNYHIMMTDGIWNEAVTGFNNADSSKTNLGAPTTDLNPNITTYLSRKPYSDDYNNTLADVAFHYWITDLVNLENILAPVYNDRSGASDAIRFWNAKNDPATWQHMVNFNIGLGLSGYIKDAGLTWSGNTYTGSYPKLTTDGSGVVWPNASSKDQNPANVADLWHAAINSRGQFFSADDPASLAASFASALTAITGSNGSSAALSANSTSVRTEATLVYQAKFNRDWSGTLLALPISTAGLVGEKVWDAGELIPDTAKRQIFTLGDKAGAEFKTCANISTVMRDALNVDIGTGKNLCQDRLNWLRGDTSKEQSKIDGVFRNRPPWDSNPEKTKVMGDIINSDPAYVEATDQGYSELNSKVPGQSSYADFQKGIAKRPAMVYVGANDGMMHGVFATTGVEQFAYVPRGVSSTIARLTDPAYTHRFYVDGGITTGDAYATDTWKTVLVGGLNAGGKSIYALDVSNPGSFGAGQVMWEFEDPLMGLSYSQPQIGVTESGTWVAVFGNGYNNDPNPTAAGKLARGTAHLFIVDIGTGKLIKRFDVGPAAVGVDNNNGMSTPVLFDADGDRQIDAVYAGDLQGNLWKFDLSGTTVGDWKIGAGGQALYAPAKGDEGKQPITSQPKVGGHPNGGSVVVFGTGRYLGLTDVFDKTMQTYYGIRDDKDVAVAGRTNLQVQTLTQQELNKTGQLVRTVSATVPDWSKKRGWYLDLKEPNVPSDQTLIGERVVSTSLIKYGRAIFVTVIPSTDPCQPGGMSWLMEVDLVNGGTFLKPILDTNGDGNINEKDDQDGEVVGGIRLDGLGISKTPVWLDCQDKGCKVLTGTSGGFATKLNEMPKPPEDKDAPVQRRSWIQIR